MPIKVSRGSKIVLCSKRRALQGILEAHKIATLGLNNRNSEVNRGKSFQSLAKDQVR